MKPERGSAKRRREKMNDNKAKKNEEGKDKSTRVKDAQGSVSKRNLDVKGPIPGVSTLETYVL